MAHAGLNRKKKKFVHVETSTLNPRKFSRDSVVRTLEMLCIISDTRMQMSKKNILCRISCKISRMYLLMHYYSINTTIKILINCSYEKKRKFVKIVKIDVPTYLKLIEKRGKNISF